MSLTEVKIRSIKAGAKQIELSDGKGLQLLITPAGGKSWKLAYRVRGKQKTLTIGPYPEVSLQQAREKACEAERQLADGQDPAEAKRIAKLVKAKEASDTFALVAAKLLDKKKREGRAPATLGKHSWLHGLANADLGARPVSAITTRAGYQTGQGIGAGAEGTRRMTVTYAAFDISDYLDNDEVIAEYLTAAAQDASPDVLLAALSHVAKARGYGPGCQGCRAWPREPLQSPVTRRAPPLRDHQCRVARLECEGSDCGGWGNVTGWAKRRWRVGPTEMICYNVETTMKPRSCRVER